MSQGQYQEAETLQARVVLILERTLGAEHPQTLTSRSNLANVLFLQGRAADAEVLHRRARPAPSPPRWRTCIGAP